MAWSVRPAGGVGGLGSRWGRALACGLAALLGTWAGAVRPAAASCGGIHVSVPLFPLPGHVLSVSWSVSPSCAVIETGLLLGRDPSTLVPVGRPIYAYRERYVHDLIVETSGEYWVAAYARDEGGRLVQSPPRSVVVTVPSPGFDAPHGSHGAPPSYAGDDRDFLRPAGQPHYASLHSTILVRHEVRVTEDPIALHLSGRLVHEERLVSSTDRYEVELLQGHPFVLEGEVIPVESAAIRRELDKLDQAFADAAFPRPGLYSLLCRGTAVFWLIGGLRSKSSTCLYVLEPFMGYGEASSSIDRERPFARETNSVSLRSRATYFVPAAPPGARVRSAKLRVEFFGFGDFSRLTLNGKAPVTMGTAFCLFCRAWATWDFTEEVRALAAQGGGSFTVVPDPLPPASRHFFFTDIEGSIYNFSLAASYPWHHGNEDRALTVSFEEDCPRELTVSLDSDTVRPVLPLTQAQTAGVVGRPTKVPVTVSAKTCPSSGQTPEPVEVTLEVRAQMATDDTGNGGHQHHAPVRPTGTLNEYYFRGGQPTAICRIAQFDDQGIGRCEMTYHARDIAGTEAIVARAPEYPEASAQVTVRVEDFVPLSPNPSLYVLVGAPSNHAGTNDPCRPNRPASLHEENHYGRSVLVANVVRIAGELVRVTGILPRINDMSLPWGGLFDFRNSWIPPHVTHRTGRDVDIGFSGVQNGTCVDYDRDDLKFIIRTITNMEPLKEPDHFHVYGG